MNKSNTATPKDIIIADIIVSIVLIAIMLLLITFEDGWNMKIVRNVQATPYDVREAITGKLGSEPGAPNNKVTWITFNTYDDRVPDKIQVPANGIYHTGNLTTLKKIVEDGENISINLYVSKKSGAVIGATSNSTSILGYFYSNYFIFKFGLYSLIGINIFLIGLSLFMRNKLNKSRNMN